MVARGPGQPEPEPAAVGPGHVDLEGQGGLVVDPHRPVVGPPAEGGLAQPQGPDGGDHDGEQGDGQHRPVDRGPGRSQTNAHVGNLQPRPRRCAGRHRQLAAGRSGGGARAAAATARWPAGRAARRAATKVAAAATARAKHAGQRRAGSLLFVAGPAGDDHRAAGPALQQAVPGRGHRSGRRRPRRVGVGGRPAGGARLEQGEAAHQGQERPGGAWSPSHVHLCPDGST